MKFTQLLSEKNIRQGLICASKKRTFEIIGQIVASDMLPKDLDENIENLDELTKAQENCCIECLFTREKIGNSALGNGLAMPKGRLPSGDKPFAVFLQLAQGVDYEASDHRDVDLIFALLLPSEICAEFSQHLPTLTARLSDKALCKKLRSAQSVEEIWQIFAQNDAEFAEQQALEECAEHNEDNENHESQAE